MIMRSRFLLALVVGVLALGLFASAQQVTLTHWQHAAHLRAVVTDALARDFEARVGNLRIQTEHIPFGQYFDKLVTGLATRTASDVMQVPADMANQLIGAGLLAPLPPTIMTTAQVDAAYFGWMRERFRVDGRYYGIPVDAQSLVVFINDRLYAQAGYTPADYPRTWEQFAEQAKRLVVRDAARNMTQAGVDTRYFRALLMTAMYCGIDGPVVTPQGVTYDRPENQAGFRWLESMLRGPDRVRDPVFLPGQRPFDLGRAVFYVNHPSARASINEAFRGTQFTWTAIPLPRQTAASPACTVGSNWAWVVNSNSRNIDAAWRWIIFATRLEAQYKWFEESGDLPTMPVVALDPRLIRTENDRVLIRSLDYARPEEQIGRTEIAPIQSEIWERLTLTNDPLDRILRETAAKENAAIRQILGR
jgi:multiple sugar transport system substrate-binding protein